MADVVDAGGRLTLVGFELNGQTGSHAREMRRSRAGMLRHPEARK